VLAQKDEPHKPLPMGVVYGKPTAQISPSTPPLAPFDPPFLKGFRRGKVFRGGEYPLTCTET